jgi:hypothetical protein
MIDLALVVNSHETSEDLWPVYIGELNRYGWDRLFRKIYFFNSRNTNLPATANKINIELLQYDSDLPYNLQYLSCLKRVPFEFVIIANEDCIPSGPPLFEEVKRITSIISSGLERIDFVKFVKGQEYISETKYANLYQIDPMSEMFFTQQLSLWCTKSLLEVYAMSPTSYIARKGGVQQETLGSDVCRTQGMKGLLYYNQEPKRGLYHYDSGILPHICTAIVGGRWNFAEYSTEIAALTVNYNLPIMRRGIYAGH